MMGNCRSFSLPEEQLRTIAEDTGFTRKQILRLYARFQEIDKEGHGYLLRDDFFEISELEANPLGDRIIDAFFAETNEPEKKMRFADFAHVLAHFRPCNDGKTSGINSRKEKLKFAFAMYDLSKNGFITRFEFKVILSMMVGSNISNEQLDSITDRTITEGDYKKDGKISFEEFSQAMEKLHIEELMSIRFVE